MEGKWTKNGFVDNECPLCGGETEYFEHHGSNYKVYLDAERCPACRWQINFEPETHKVHYGSPVETCPDED
jgi:hypothetical protein